MAADAVYLNKRGVNAAAKEFLVIRTVYYCMWRFTMMRAKKQHKPRTKTTTTHNTPAQHTHTHTQDKQNMQQQKAEKPRPYITMYIFLLPTATLVG